jgi:glutamate--cysteine ligase
MNQTDRTTEQSPVDGIEDLLGYFREAEKPRDRWRVGTEHEKVGVYADTGDRVPYEGPYGIGALLEKFAEQKGWDRIQEGGRTIGLAHDGASVTLEPGGQIELSGAPLRTARETCIEFNTHVDLVKELSDEFGIAWLGLGIDPFHDVADIPIMPKKRYDIMRAYLPTRGGLALEMMHATATVQANFDYADEADMIEKMRMALVVTPIVSALFANSSISGGKENGYVSRRLVIWRDTDPDRCGLIPFVFDPDFGYRRYAEWALDVPLFFIVRDGTYHAGDGTTFRQFMERGFAGARPTLSDWDMHLTTLFPDVRLKRIIEVRGADAVPREGICALPALWKGLLYDEGAREAAWTLLSETTMEQLDDAQLDVARRGLRAEMGGRKVLDLARELVSYSSEGLRQLLEADETDQDETHFLDPLRAQIERGISPGEEIAERWRGEWDRNRERLIEATRY